MQISSELTETTSLRLRDDLHLLRKAWHIGTGLTGLVLYYKTGASAYTMASILFSVAMAGFLFDAIRLKNQNINNVAVKFMGPFMRESETTGFSGLPFYALGTSISLFFFPEKIAVLSIIFLIFADPISSIFGIKFGRDKILPNKSLQGTVAGFITCYVVTIVYCLGTAGADFNLLIFALLAGVIGACSELLSVFVDDNLTVPVVSGLGLTFINLFFNIL